MLTGDADLGSFGAAAWALAPGRRATTTFVRRSDVVPSESTSGLLKRLVFRHVCDMRLIFFDAADSDNIFESIGRNLFLRRCRHPRQEREAIS